MTDAFAPPQYAKPGEELPALLLAELEEVLPWSTALRAMGPILKLLEGLEDDVVSNHYGRNIA